MEQLIWETVWSHVPGEGVTPDLGWGVLEVDILGLLGQSYPGNEEYRHSETCKGPI